MKIVILFSLVIFAGCSSTQYDEYSNLSWIRESIYIDSNIETVWQIVGENFDQASKHMDSVEKSYYLEKHHNMTSSIRRSELVDGNFIDVKVKKYVPYTYIEWEMVETSVNILKQGVGSYTIVKENSGVRLIQHAGFQTYNGLTDSIAKSKFKSMFAGILAGIKFQVETGQQVPESKSKELVDTYRDSFL